METCQRTLNEIRGTYQEYKDTIFRPKVRSGPTSQSGIDAEERKFIVDFRRHYAHDEQGGPRAWRARDFHCFEQTHNSYYG